MTSLIIGCFFAVLALIVWVMIAKLAWKFYTLAKLTKSEYHKQMSMTAVFMCLVMLFFLAQTAATIALRADEQPKPMRRAER